MTKNNVRIKRVPRTMRLLPSTLKVIEDKSKIYDMTIGEYIEYVVGKDTLPNDTLSNEVMTLIDQLCNLREGMDNAFAIAERERVRQIEKDREVDADTTHEWLKCVVDRIKRGEIKGYEEIYHIIREGVEDYNLTDYGVSIIENTYNKAIPIRK